MSEQSWSTCTHCNTTTHTTAQHPVTDPVADSLYQQPDPAPAASRDVLPLVMADYEARMRYYAGPEQYGVPLRIDNLRDHLRDAYAEALDLPGYLKAAMVLWDEMRATMGTIAAICQPLVTEDRHPDLWVAWKKETEALEAIAALVAPYR